jgi:hypothetical protein
MFHSRKFCRLQLANPNPKPNRGSLSSTICFVELQLIIANPITLYPIKATKLRLVPITPRCEKLWLTREGHVITIKGDSQYGYSVNRHFEKNVSVYICIRDGFVARLA